MKLVKVSVRNYRSILDASNLQLDNYTVLVGPNNEGKSNILKATTLGLAVLSRATIVERTNRVARYGYMGGSDSDYSWERDYPVQLQNKTPDGRSIAILEFELNEMELCEFRDTVGVDLSTNLKIRLSFGKRDVRPDILMQGKAKERLNSKRKEVMNFVRNRLVVQYISAIRPAEFARSVVDRVLDAELRQLEKKQEYLRLLEAIESMQKPVLEAISQRITETVREFIPDVASISVQSGEGIRRAARSHCSILVDDGARTELQLKGDGVISLTSISLVRQISQQALEGKHLVFAIEEPESHLHPKGVYALRQVLKEIAKQNQVIITTHSPLLVERVDIGRNVIVLDGKARRAERISEVRDALGVQVSDNLTNAVLVLLVEGENDLRALRPLLAAASPEIRLALDRGHLALESLTGASKLPYAVSLHKQALSAVHVLLDGDDEGRRAIDDALKRGVLTDIEYTLVNCKGMSQCELEDIFAMQSYQTAVQKRFGVQLAGQTFRGNKKWSERARSVFESNGKRWSARTETQVKRVVADAVAMTGIRALNQHKRSSFDALVRNLEGLLSASA